MVKERENLRVVGRDLRKVEAESKARGECVFPSDISLPGMLHCRVLHSPHAHALVTRIDTSRAERLAGVKAVITHKDCARLISRSPFFYLPGFIVRDTCIVEKEVRYVGDRVAAVAAVSPDVAEEALGLIDVEYEKLPAVFDALQAMRPEAPPVHRTLIRGEDEVPVQNNTIRTFTWSMGDLDDGFKQADEVVENEFNTGSVHNAPMERSVMVCRPRAGGRLEVWTTTQGIHGIKITLARALGLPANKIKVHRLYPGGGFGLRLNLSFVDLIGAVLALKTGLPVKAEESREEMFLCGGRHSFNMKLRTGVTKDGIITASHMRAVDDTGAYCVGDMVGLMAGWFMSMYRCPNKKFEGSTVYTNTPPRTSMRGVANPQQNFAVEQQMDILAERLNMDPVELRLKNHVRAGDIFYGQGRDVVSVVQTCGTEQLLRDGARAIGWEHRKAVMPYPDKPWIKRGIGMARGFHTSGAGGTEPSSRLMDYSGAIVKMNEDATCTLLSPCADSGSGGLSAHAAIVAEELGIRYEDVIVAEADTDITPYDPGTHASRSVYCQGMAARAAAVNLKKVILEWAARILKAPADQLDISDRRVYLRPNPSVGIGLEEVVQTAHHRSWGTAMATASLRAPACPPHYTTMFVEVDVDTLTGEVKLVRAVGGADVGTPINVSAVKGQIIGGMHMGMGFALTESTVFDPVDGHVVNPDFTDYKILRSVDMPRMEIMLADTWEPTGPFGAKGLGEGATNHVAAAVANAIYNAIGARVYSLPITPEKILEAMKSQRGDK